MFTKMTSWGRLSTYFDLLEMAVDGSIVRGARGKGRSKRKKNQGDEDGREGKKWRVPGDLREK